MRGHRFALQANQRFFTKQKQKKIELVARPDAHQDLENGIVKELTPKHFHIDIEGQATQSEIDIIELLKVRSLIETGISKPGGKGGSQPGGQAQAPGLGQSKPPTGSQGGSKGQAGNSATSNGGKPGRVTN